LKVASQFQLAKPSLHSIPPAINFSEQSFDSIVFESGDQLGLLRFDPGGVSMCDKCIELDGKMERYQRLSSRITDQRTLDGIAGLIASMKAQKTALHPEQKE
jgi:hypothetical protein